MTFRGHDFGLSDSETYEKRLETAVPRKARLFHGELDKRVLHPVLGGENIRRKGAKIQRQRLFICVDQRGESGGVAV